MGLFLGRETRSALSFPEPPIPPFPGADSSGQVSVGSQPDLAMTVSTVWACVSLLAGAISSLPLETFQRDPGNPTVPKRVAVDPPIVSAPDSAITQSAWLHQVVVSLMLRGNAIGRITARDAQLLPTNIVLMNPDLIGITVDKTTGALVYKVLTTQQVIPLEDVWHLAGMTMPGSRVGLSPISYAAATLGLDLAARSFASGFLGGGGIPKAVIESDQQIDQEEARTLKDRIMASLRGREPIVLGLGTKYTQVQVSPEESQFLLTQQHNVGQIARFFCVPAEMVGGQSGGSMTYSNREQRSLDFLVYSLSPWLKRIEDALAPLLPGQQFVKFNVSALLRTDVETQTKVFLQLMAGHALTPTEVRAEIGRDPLTALQLAEIEAVPITATPLGGVKARPAVGVAPPDITGDNQGEPNA